VPLYRVDCRGKISVIQEIKPITLYWAVIFINQKLIQIVQIVPKISACDLLSGRTWRSFSDVIIICFSKFILKAQADCTFLPDLSDEDFRRDKGLENVIKNEFSHHLRIALTGGMQNTTDGRSASSRLF
jgi:hypothetical protein